MKCLLLLCALAGCGHSPRSPPARDPSCIDACQREQDLCGTELEPCIQACLFYEEQGVEMGNACVVASDTCEEAQDC